MDESTVTERSAKIAYIKKAIMELVDEFNQNPEPGKILDVPHLFKMEYLPDLQISLLNKGTGEVRIFDGSSGGATVNLDWTEAPLVSVRIIDESSGGDTLPAGKD